MTWAITADRGGNCQGVLGLIRRVAVTDDPLPGKHEIYLELLLGVAGGVGAVRMYITGLVENIGRLFKLSEINSLF